MTDEAGPWKKEWHLYVENRPDLGGDYADEIDIYRDVVKAPMDNEASGQNEGSSGRLALPTTGTIVDKMVKADVTGAADISERMHQSNLMNEPLPLLRILPVYELLSIEAEKAESTEEQDRLSELADLAKMAILITCAHDVSKSDRAEMISIVQEKLDGLSMIDYDRLVLQSLINNSNS